MLKRTIVAIGIAAIGLPAGFAYAGAANSLLPNGTAMTEAIPSYVATYASKERTPRGMTIGRGVEPVAQAEGALSLSYTALDDGLSGEKTKKSYRPVLYSLLWPGTGEVALGYRWRGVALITLEAVAWAGYLSYRDQGLESREAFEAFADANWTHDKWIGDHPAVEGLSDEFKTFEVVDSIGRNHWTGWPGYHTYAAKDDVKLNYYENIGKYDWFISGWKDWDAVNKPRDTDLRTEYRGMRKKSNDELSKADRFIYLSIATRVFSLLETFLLIRMNDPDEPSQSQGDNSFRFTARSTGLYSGEIAFEYRFR